MPAAKDAVQRRVPRRLFEAGVGVLWAGSYSIERTLRVGEGGMLISTKLKLAVGQFLVVSFQIPGRSLFCARAAVKTVETQANGDIHVAIQFENLQFHYKRELRNFVAAATQDQILL